MRSMGAGRRVQGEGYFVASPLFALRSSFFARLACGQAVGNLWVSLRKKSAAFHTAGLNAFFTHKIAMVLPFLNTTFTQLFRNQTSEFSSVNCQFYPLSPGPIIKTTKYSY